MLCDQLEAPGAIERCRAFLRDVRPASHALDIEAAEDPAVAAELERAAGEYARALRAPAATTCSPRSRPSRRGPAPRRTRVLPLLATDAGVRLQVRTGIESHRARFGDGWRGGFWLPECAHAPWLRRVLEEAGVHATCVDLTDVFGPGDRAPPAPAGHRGRAAARAHRPRRRSTSCGRRAATRRTAPIATTTAAPRATTTHGPTTARVYDPARAAEQAASDAADFVARVGARVADGGLCVCALDTELLGHWWHEGPRWLALVVERGARSGLELVHLDDALADCDPAPAGDAAERVTTWGTPARPLDMVGPAGRRPGLGRARGRARRARRRRRRSATARCASCWRCRAATGPSWRRPAPRATTRASASHGHAAALRAALADPGAEPALRNLAPRLARAALLEP